MRERKRGIINTLLGEPVKRLYRVDQGNNENDEYERSDKNE